MLASLFVSAIAAAKLHVPTVARTGVPIATLDATAMMMASETMRISSQGRLTGF
ncbi:hypothetical protein N2601_30885 (plasmid) [Rhizobium sp. CB3060]|uniref:hypothetical protein n=1 Tax=Rhizobium sp. CB3060 TaxID=3138255 RepID=UPI0021A52956|nr:hypothetical protein [Rhizobium tropici]UWU25403.1 hypothetical protein N2601_30885 [Rhizobium tropici]